MENIDEHREVAGLCFLILSVVVTVINFVYFYNYYHDYKERTSENGTPSQEVDPEKITVGGGADFSELTGGFIKSIEEANNPFGVEDLCSWIQSHYTLQNVNDVIYKLTVNSIDGKTFMSLTYDDLIELGINRFHVSRIMKDFEDTIYKDEGRLSGRPSPSGRASPHDDETHYTAMISETIGGGNLSTPRKESNATAGSKRTPGYSSSPKHNNLELVPLQIPKINTEVEESIEESTSFQTTTGPVLEVTSAPGHGLDDFVVVHDSSPPTPSIGTLALDEDSYFGSPQPYDKTIPSFPQSIEETCPLEDKHDDELLDDDTSTSSVRRSSFSEFGGNYILLEKLGVATLSSKELQSLWELCQKDLNTEFIRKADLARLLNSWIERQDIAEELKIEFQQTLSERSLIMLQYLDKNKNGLISRVQFSKVQDLKLWENISYNAKIDEKKSWQQMWVTIFQQLDANEELTMEDIYVIWSRYEVDGRMSIDEFEKMLLHWCQCLPLHYEKSECQVDQSTILAQANVGKNFLDLDENGIITWNEFQGIGTREFWKVIDFQIPSSVRDSIHSPTSPRRRTNLSALSLQSDDSEELFDFR